MADHQPGWRIGPTGEFVSEQCQRCGREQDTWRVAPAWRIPRRCLCPLCQLFVELGAYGQRVNIALAQWMRSPAIQRLLSITPSIIDAAEQDAERRNNDTAVLRARQAHQLRDARRNRT